MKNQLLNWGFRLQKGSDWYELTGGETTIILKLINDDIKSVYIFIHGYRASVPNCTTKLALFTFLYNLGLIEI